MSLYAGIDLTKAPSPAFALCYYTTGVELGTYNKEEGFSFNGLHREEDLTQMHIFNEKEELRAVYSFGKKKFIQAIIEDDCNTDYLDEFMHLFGEKYLRSDNKKTYLEDKGSKKEIHFPVEKDDFEKGLSIGIRNYLKYDNNGMVSIENFRMTGIYKGKKERQVLAYV